MRENTKIEEVYTFMPDRKMELPEDVLGLVREFSRPVFKHFQVYNQALKIFGKEKWPALQKKLQCNPEAVLPTFLSYQEVYLNRKETMKQISMHREIIPKGILHRGTRSWHGIATPNRASAQNAACAAFKCPRL